MKAHAAAMIRGGVDPETVAATMKAEQDEIRAIEVARLAEHMAGRLPHLDAEGQRMVIGLLDLTGVMEDPARADSPVRITSLNGAAALADTGLLSQGCP